jgi:hypothetical protein
MRHFGLYFSCITWKGVEDQALLGELKSRCPWGTVWGPLLDSDFNIVSSHHTLNFTRPDKEMDDENIP